jgi:hypothetical protein
MPADVERFVKRDDTNKRNRESQAEVQAEGGLCSHSSLGCERKNTDGRAGQH